MSDSDATEPTTVYRCFGADGVLLYVGMTGNWKRRRAAHKRRAPFWSEVAYTVTVDHPSRRAAGLAEVEAIRNESPVHNKAPGGGRVGPRPIPPEQQHLVDNLVEATRRLAEIQRQVAEASAEVDEAVLDTRATEGWGLDRLAAAAGVSKSRMQKRVNRLKEAGLA